jgi:hypothetical protein
MQNGSDHTAPRGETSPISARAGRSAVRVTALLTVLALRAGAAHAQSGDIVPGAADFLYVWATAFDTAGGRPSAPAAVTRPRRRGVFLATVDLRAGSPTRGRVVNAVLAADTAGRAAHHTEHALAADGLLFANDFFAGRTYRFDLRAPGTPRLAGGFAAAGPFGYPHSFVRLAGGTVLATFQGDATGRPPGGLAELRRDGSVARWARAAAPDVDSTFLQPYSLEPLPALDRVVSTSTSMRQRSGVHVQVWRLSDLALLHTLALPAAPNGPESAASPTAAGHAGHAAHAGTGDEADAPRHLLPGEPRVLADGRTVLLGTFTCGLYRLTGIDGPAPRLDRVHAFPGRDCAVPARVGRWWVQTVPALRALVALDVADPARPREVSRLAFGDSVRPHWLAADAAGRRLVMTSGTPDDPRLHLVTLDPGSGALAPDRVVPAVDLARVPVPGLGVVRAVPHGAVFGAGAP